MSDETIKDVLKALKGVKIGYVESEYVVHEAVAVALAGAGIVFVREAAIAPRSRIDFYCQSRAGNIGIEIKRGKLNRRTVVRQLLRYAETGKIDELVLVSERAIPGGVPPELAGIPVHTVNLALHWGIATK